MAEPSRSHASAGASAKASAGAGATASAGAAGLALAAFVAGLLLTPAASATAEGGFAGVPRLVLFAAAGVVLAWSASWLCGWGFVRADWSLAGPQWRAYAPVAIGTALALGMTAVNVARLQSNIADSLGPELWLLAMLALLVGGIGSSRPRLIRARHSSTDIRHAEGEVRRAEGEARRGGETRPAEGEMSHPAGGRGQAWQGAPWIPWLGLLGLLVVGAALRLLALDSVPLGINADEGDRAATALDVLNGQAPPSWFDSGWFFINMVYFRLLAVDMAVFGRDIGGTRMLSALVGIATLLALSWLGIRFFGWRRGLVALALATASALTLMHSRFVSEAAPTGVLWIVSVAAFLEAARREKPWAFIVAGLAGGLSLYFYPSARLWAVGAVLTVLALLVFRRRPAMLVGSALAAAAAVIAAAPFLVHLQSHPDEVAGRYQQTAVLDPSNQDRLSYLASPEPLPRLALLQVERTLGMFDRYPDGGGFLPTERPMFPEPIGGLVIVAIAYGLWLSLRDLRLAVLSIWLWVGLSGVLLTVETPDMIRAVGILPAVYVLLALVLVDVVDRLLALAARLRASGALPAFSVGIPLGIGLLVLVTDATWFFGTFRDMPEGWGRVTREGEVIARLGERGPVYSIETNEHMVTSGWVRWLANNAPRGRVPNPGRELPLLAPVVPAPTQPTVIPAPGQGLSVLLSGDPNQDTYTELLYQLYPGGRLEDADDQRRAYVVTPEFVSGVQGVALRGTPGVSRFGELPPGWSGGPAVWSAGILVPRGARLTFETSGQLRIDNKPVLSSELVPLAPGLHYVELMDSGPSRLLVNGQELEPRQTYRLMTAPWGLLGRAAGRPDPFVDATVATAFLSPELQDVPIPTSVTWTGTLLAPRDGLYRMAFAAEDPMSLELDGSPLSIATVGPDAWSNVGEGTPVMLAAGPHRVQVTQQVTHGGRNLARWNWVPPRADGTLDQRTPWTVVPPSVLRPDSDF